MKVLFLLAICTMVMVACGGQTDTDYWFEPQESQEQDEVLEPTPFEQEAIAHTPTDAPQTTVNVMVNNANLTNFLIYQRLFNRSYPDIQINIETFRPPSNITEHMALITRLIADPPDMLVYQGIDFSKSQLPSLFADLNTFFDGPDGINRNNFFNNIFLAAQMQGGLFHAPFHINVDFAFLNKRLFDAIGVDATTFTSFTYADAVYYFPRIQEALQDEELFISHRFSLWDVLMYSRLFDLETGEVFVNTPAMQNLIEATYNIPYNEEFVEFTPHIINNGILLDDFNRIRHVQSTPHLLYLPFEGITELSTFFLVDHPDLQFTHPIHFGMFGQDDQATLPFTATTSMAIPAGSQETQGAWQFMRFILEVEDDFWQEISYIYVDGEWIADVPEDFINTSRYLNRRSWTINRNRFDNQVGSDMQRTQDSIHRLLHLPTPEEDQVTIAMDFYRQAMENVNFERLFDEPAMFSLAYPDIWLLVSGQQDIPQTLYNIHNRLELYVNE